MAAFDPQHPVRGWLLVFVLWMAINICLGVGTSVYDLAISWNVWPVLRTAGLLDCLITVIWYVAWAFCLYALVRQLPKCVKWTKIMLIGSVAFAAIMPALIAFFINQTLGVPLSRLISAMYSPYKLGSISGTAIASSIWYAYFCVSKRIRTLYLFNL